MVSSSRPVLALYVVWHPNYKTGDLLSKQLFAHYRRDLYLNTGGGNGLSVMNRSEPAPGSTVPLPIPLDQSETTVVVVFAESNLTSDPAWITYVQNLSARTDTASFTSRLVVVALDGSFLKLNLTDNALRCDKGRISGRKFNTVQMTELTHQICRVLRFFHEHLDHPGTPEDRLESYLTKIRVFISHTKKDRHGLQIAIAIRDQLHQANGLDSFFDVHDIPAGVRFDQVIFHRVKTSIVIVVHSDTFSSREWCRKEVLAAKRSNVPLIVANCIKDADDRGFPYLGNVPIIRMDDPSPHRIDCVIGRLFDEVLKDFLWKCRVALCAPPITPGPVFVPRTPELLMLAAIPKSPSAGSTSTVVYPDPPMGSEEIEILNAVSPSVHFTCLSSWLAGVAP